MDRIVQWLKYYRASLIDGSIKPKNNIYGSTVRRTGTYLGHLEPQEIKGLQGVCRQKLFVVGEKGNETEVDIIDIEIAPVFFIDRESEHTKTKTKSADDKHYPFWIRARINRKGELLPPEENDIPVFLRNYLAPNPKDSPVIAEMDRLDVVLASWTAQKASWKEYWESCEKFFTAVTGKTYRDFQGERTTFYFGKYGDINTIRNILNLYDQLLDESFEPENRLLREILTEQLNPVNKELIAEGDTEARNSIFLNRKHYGQMGCDFPLSRSQRIALSEYMEDNGTVFAVNGPPGTGKTTLLQSVIANQVVMSVLDGRDPVLMVGCSTNNQAITNILDSMQLREGKAGLEESPGDLLARRWLPVVSSFGLYLTSEQKAKGDSDNKNYQIATSYYLNDGFVGDIDQKERAGEFDEYFICRAAEALGLASDATKVDVNKTLQKKIKTAKRAIDHALAVTEAYIQIPQALKSEGVGSTDELDATINKLAGTILREAEFLKLLDETEAQLSGCHKRLPILYRYLPFSRCRKYRSNKYRIVILPITRRMEKGTEWHNYRSIETEIDRIKLDSLNEVKHSRERYERLRVLREDMKQRERKYKTLFDSWGNEYWDRWNRVIRNKPELGSLSADEDTALRLDISYRHDLFWLCVHLREGEFIEKLEKKKDEGGYERSQADYEAKLRRLALVTPLFISTFHSLPRFCQYYSHESGNVFYRDLFDLMIVDEAGQVAPELAVPTLALAKRVLAVGDTRQIEPVAGVTGKIDFANAKMYGLVSEDDQFDKLCGLGFMASECSLMQLVKKSCSYKFSFENEKEDKGAYLREHYRCLDDIIRYSNEYVYNGCLVLQGGKDHGKEHGLPPMGYVHINGTDEAFDKSRRNDMEARVIVEWIYQNRRKIEGAYGLDVGKVLAVIAPFRAQIDLIGRYMKEWFGEKDCPRITIGTVHALQGAGREIVIFSSVYGRNSGAMFFDLDNKYNMLNVAVTRAKHSFIVFGNMRIFQPHRNMPSGNLAKVLFAKAEFNLGEEFIYASERVYKGTDEYKVARLSTLEKHIDCLKYCFQEAEKRLLIFSPFISISALQSDGITDRIRQAIGQRNVDILIVTDEQMDKQGNKLKEAALKGRQALSEAGARVIVTQGVHNKTICMDDSLLVEGSFNWLSAARDKNSPYCRKEASVFIRGGRVKEMIQKVVENFMLEDIII